MVFCIASNCNDSTVDVLVHHPAAIMFLSFFLETHTALDYTHLSFLVFLICIFLNTAILMDRPSRPARGWMDLPWQLQALPLIKLDHWDHQLILQE